MYRVMIIDDERALRSLLKASVDWNSLGYEVVGEATSGIEAINTIDKYNPDLVFVDIRMPFMDGIEFSKILRERYPHIQIVILTAYDEFDYARSCVGLGITDYLLKPIVREDIIQVCQKAAAILAQRPQNQDTEETVSYTIKESDMIAVQEYIQENYSQPSLNVTALAERFGYSTGYLSRRFKSVVGMNVSDFIMKCRMDAALTCIKENKRMYVTATQVGIPDPHYFGKCFKKYVGKSYSELLNNKEETLHV